MQKIIPVYYSEYGRYINRFRAIPSYIDCLKPVERRILVTLHEIARNQFTKSAKIVGACIGKYHPHGDQSVYGTLVNLVQQKFAIGKGNWGSPGLVDAEAAQYRYTEAKLNPQIEDLVFKYIDYVAWEELELEPEPLYLPSPVPVGLIGTGVITGISFYRTLIPKYMLSDLATRLLWLIDSNFSPNVTIKEDEELDQTSSGPKIQPHIVGCDIAEDGINQFYKLLLSGIGTIIVIPYGKIENKVIKILGRAPNASFNSLIENKDSLEIYLNDLSKQQIDVEIIPQKRGVNLNTLAAKIWDDYLIKKLNFNCVVCDHEGKVNTVGIDTLLYNSYHAWKYAVLQKNVADYNKLVNKKIELFVIQIIRYIFEEYKCTQVSEIVQYFLKLTKDKKVEIEFEEYDVDSAAWKKNSKIIEEQDIIDVCNKRNIRNLIENKIDIQKVEGDIQSAKSIINSIDNYSYKYIQELRKEQIK